MYTCPKCGLRTVEFDSRCRCLMCLMLDCCHYVEVRNEKTARELNLGLLPEQEVDLILGGRRACRDMTADTGRAIMHVIAREHNDDISLVFRDHAAWGLVMDNTIRRIGDAVSREYE